MKKKLEQSSSSEEALNEIKQYLIMERINPPEIKAFMLKKGKLIEASATLQELGIYSSLFINTNTENGKDLVEEHEIFGKLIRTKGADSDEGGVVTGFSVVDQPWVTSEIGPLTPSLQVKPLISTF